MTAIERLRRDHAILRAKLNVVEAALRMGPEVWYVLREVCFTLARQLRDHIRREEDLVAACRSAMISPPAGKPEAGPFGAGIASGNPPAGGGMNPKVLAEIVVEHRDEPEHLRAINQLFLGERGHSLERIRPELEEVIRRLRHHMAEEEAELFPILERTLAEPPPAEPAGPRAPFDETTTVNRMVQEFPRTRPVFERLLINVPAEGCACLDEVAWRHGIEARELLQLLEQAVGSCGCARHESPQPADRVSVDA